MAGKTHRSCRALIFAVAGVLLLGASYSLSDGKGRAGAEDETFREPRVFAGDDRALYHAYWNGIPVASAEIRSGSVWVDGRGLVQVRIEARTWRYLDLIWKMRDSIDSLFDPEHMQSAHYVFAQNENRRHTITVAFFDSEHGKWVVRRERGTKVRDEEFVAPTSVDPILAVYLARNLSLKLGESVSLEVFGGRSRYAVTLTVEARETVTVNGRAIDAYRVAPKVFNLNEGGYAGRVRQATVWISADEERRPLKLVSSVFVGSVTVELVG